MRAGRWTAPSRDGPALAHLAAQIAAPSSAPPPSCISSSNGSWANLAPWPDGGGSETTVLPATSGRGTSITSRRWAGSSLRVGGEVDSRRQVTRVDAFAEVDRGEAWLHQVDIGVYTFAHGRNHDPRRKRKLLLHRREIDRLAGKIREKGYTLVPLSLYEKNGRVKAELALVHGKQSWDKREDSKKRESQREIDRAMASRRR